MRGEERDLYPRPRERRVERDEAPRSALSIWIRRFIYLIAAAGICAAWAAAYRSYFRHYDGTHPEIVWAKPWMHDSMVKIRGVLLWDEVVLKAPHAGTVIYPQGPRPHKVVKGAVVARVKSGGKLYDVKSPESGYFVGGADGREGAWRYSDIWLEDDIPDVGEIELFADGRNVAQGGAVGKLVPQPQELRFICYADANEAMREALASKRLMLKMDETDTSSRAEVRVSEEIGHLTKIYLTMPWFPPRALLSRAAEVIVDTGGEHGVVIPDSAVTERDGETGAFVIRGSESVFCKVRGKAVDGGKFMVQEGVKLGDAVVVDGESAMEGRVSLW